MIRLYNGRGQLGSELINYINLEIECDIYHTWNFLDKNFEIQKKEYEKYCNYIKNKKHNQPFYFISTKNNCVNSYTFFKKLAELKTLEFGGTVIRIPNLIGRGFCDKLLEGKEAFSSVEVIPISECCQEIIKIILKTKKEQINEITGVSISSHIIKEILLYGKMQQQKLS